MKEIDLSNIHACQSEMQDCSRGLAYLDHIYGQVIDDLSACELNWNQAEAAAAKAVRMTIRKGATAAEVKGAIHDWITNVAYGPQARENLRKARDRKEKVDRWMRSLEKRLSAAQSAQNGHQALGKYGGGA